VAGTPKARNLVITSPLMSGKDVTIAQQHLKKNVFKQDFMQGFMIDGQFGPDTGRACKRAKYWLGYALKDQQPTYGPYLAKFLIGSVKLPPDQQKLRDQRLKQQASKPLREKAFDKAVADLGMKESPPNSNRCPISNAWGMAGPWCAMAVSTWYLEAGSKADLGFVLAARTLPTVVFLLVGGIWADRLPRHRVMVASKLYQPNPLIIHVAPPTATATNPCRHLHGRRG